MHNIGKIIGEYRRKANVSQKNLADMIATNPTYLSAIEKGHRQPTFAFIERAAVALGVPMEIILWDSVDVESIPPKDRRTVEVAKTLVRYYLSEESNRRPPHQPQSHKD